MANGLTPGGIQARTVGGSLNIGPLLTTWTDLITVPEVVISPPVAGTDPSSIANNFLVDAYAQLPTTCAPTVGSKHPVYPVTFCSNVRVDPKSGVTGPSPVGVAIYVDWMSPTPVTNATPGVDPLPNHQLSVIPYQLQEIRNFDKNNNATGVVYYVAQVDPSLTSIYPPYRIADVRVMRTMHHVRITQYEDVTGDSAFDATGTNNADDGTLSQPFYNSDTWYGFPPHTLLWIGTNTDDGGLPLARTTYDFLFNSRGWNKFINVYTQQNGYVPHDLQNLPDAFLLAATESPPNVGSQDAGVPAIANSSIGSHGNLYNGQLMNGIGIFDMYDRAAFADSFTQIYIPGGS